MVFQQRAEATEIVGHDSSFTQNTACGLPIETTDGECSTGSSIGPICSSIRLVSWNSSESGILFHSNTGLPMSTEIVPSSCSTALRIAGDRLERKDLASALGPPTPGRRSACRCRKPAPWSRRN